MYELWTCESVRENLLENIIKIWSKHTMSSSKHAQPVPTRAILNFNFWSWPGLNFFKNRCSGSPASSKKFACGSRGFRFSFDCFDCLKSCLD